MKIIILLLKHNHCVRALAQKPGLAEATVSQHLKVLREAGLLAGEKRGYFMHYEVNRKVLRELAAELETLAGLERKLCSPAAGGCDSAEHGNCHAKGSGGDDSCTADFISGRADDGD